MRQISELAIDRHDGVEAAVKQHIWNTVCSCTRLASET
jgi:hypothetical protein